MHKTPLPIISVEDCTTWLAVHGAAWCHRLSATITVATCEANRTASAARNSDCRCDGCGGLENQPLPGNSFLPPVVTEEQPVEVIGIPVPANRDIPEEPTNQDRDVASAGAVITLNSFHHELMSMLEDEIEEPEFDERKPEPVQRKQRLVPVFKGRCRNCNGYMVATQERGEGISDDAVYRCFNCGWRTSPEYQQNRMLAAAGKENVRAAY